jgi:hypothetical protein
MLGWTFSDPLAFVNGSWTWRVLPPALAIVAAVLGTTLLATSFEATPTVSAPARSLNGQSRIAPIHSLAQALREAPTT